ncbi:cell division protein FtsQ/DivIB [Arenimonas composti]|uniref:Cell division protein FtsQ n=1 Tax=Arenimonas composti TR7-09 = DSM 18010 TaxID=1121013 RepID=A0A091C3P3_9GAMM|nr:cell division protein FtsQ/DivIB [Arenimonas composti]KFN51280.1 hypothetical protein P873_03165 [Arenimonas composti TR7-09 = DSM 18010]
MSALVRLLAWTLALALVAAPVVAVFEGWIAGERWPMRVLAVTGEFRQVDEQSVREAVLPLVRRGFFAVDLDAVRDAVAALPWVERVEVRKRWPDRLEIALSEHTPVARWGEDRMLSEDGLLFAAPPGAGAELPLFMGPESRASELMAFHAIARPLFLPLGLRVHTVELSARGSWSLVLSDGTVVEAGRGDPRARLARFARMLPQLHADPTRRIARADLRYTNGFAIVWADVAAPATQEGNA